jgi:hypothetical protein
LPCDRPACAFAHPGWISILRRSLVFARDTGINDGLRLRRRVTT